MAAQKSRRRSRKRRAPGTQPRAAPPRRREQRAEREVVAARTERRQETMLRAYGERPPSPFGPVPVSELAILIGGIGLVVGAVQGGGVALTVGIAVCALGVIEVTAREHFSGYRSHTWLLAAIPSVAILVAVDLAAGQPSDRALLVLPVVPVFAGLFWLFRRQFQAARQRRVARPPLP